MACYRPIRAWQAVEDVWSAKAKKYGERPGRIEFREIKDSREITLACGKCIGCRTTRQRAWALRCMHEAAETRDKDGNSLNSSFITLTYNDENYKAALDYRDYQLFMYRLRRRLGPKRFFASGEYGGQFGRAHWHAIIFGEDFPDRRPFGPNYFRSPVLEELWPHGYSSVGEASYESAAYVAGYVVKKLDGEKTRSTIVDQRTGLDVERTPERGYMSLRPGLGSKWFEKYWKEVYRGRDGIIQKGGYVMPPLKYYDKMLMKESGIELDIKQYERAKRAAEYIEENTNERLRVREQVHRAKMKHKQERD